jgi:hypothetical protein
MADAGAAPAKPNAKKPKPRMTSAITVVANPLSNGEKVSIFSDQPNGTLALENRGINAQYSTQMTNKADPATGPPVAFPSQLVSYKWKDAVCRASE